MRKLERNWVFLGLFLLLIFSLSFKTPEAEWSQDLGRHLKIGEIILKTRKIPSVNLFSYTHPDFPFINHHWLAEVVFYLIFSFLGDFGLVFLKTILILLSFFLVVKAVGSEKNWGTLLPFWVLTVLIFRERLDVRPEIFGFFFFAFYLFVFQQEKRGQTKWLFILPFIEFLWVNIHISFVFGLFLTGLWLVEKFFSPDELSNEVDPQERFNLSRKKLILGFSIFLASLFNPHFLKGVFLPFLIFKNYGYSIVENQTIFFLEKMINNPNIFFFKFGVLLGLLTFLLNQRRTIFSFLGFLVLALVATWQIRHFPFFALFLTFVFTQNLSSIFESNKFFEKTKPLLTGIGLSLCLALSFCYLTNFYYRAHDRVFRFGPSSSKIPAEAGAEFLLRTAPKAKIFNNFDIGSYLDYRLYPQTQVFADSRPEAYPEKFWEEYKKAQDHEEVWRELVEKYDVKAVFFAHTDGTPWAETFLKRIVNHSGWKIAYLDEVVVILFESSLEVSQIISKENVLEQAKKFTDHTQFIYLANFCRKVGWSKEEKILLEKALKMEPWSRWANARLAQIYLASKDTTLRYKAKSLLQKLNHPIFWF